jgi:hypothetical protein
LSFIGFQFKMAAGLKPGVPVILQELEPSSEMFKQGASLRVTGRYVKHPLTCTCEAMFFLKEFYFAFKKANIQGYRSGDTSSQASLTASNNSNDKLDFNYIRQYGVTCLVVL